MVEAHSDGSGGGEDDSSRSKSDDGDSTTNPGQDNDSADGAASDNGTDENEATCDGDCASAIASLRGSFAGPDDISRDVEESLVGECEERVKECILEARGPTPAPLDRDQDEDGRLNLVPRISGVSKKRCKTKALT